MAAYLCSPQHLQPYQPIPYPTYLINRNHPETLEKLLMSKFYAGIGSRETPQEILVLMAQIAQMLAQEGYVLRSGGAGGADIAFEYGCDQANGAKQIYLPWPGFQGRSTQDPFVVTRITEDALQLAAHFHPGWNHCSPGAKKLHARNCYQVLGLTLSQPVERVICWTPRASGSGGTGQAIRIARHFNIPVDDLADPMVAKAYQSLIQED